MRDNKGQESWNFQFSSDEKIGRDKQLPPPPKPDYSQCKLLNNSEKYDCFPEEGATVDACEARGCCWIPLQTNNKALNVPLNVPYCFYPPNYKSYTYVNVSETAYGLNAFLRRQFRSPYPDDVEIIRMDIRYETSNRVHIKVIENHTVQVYKAFCFPFSFQILYVVDLNHHIQKCQLPIQLMSILNTIL